MKLPLKGWEKIAQQMQLEIDPKVLEKNYYEMFSRYMFLKEQGTENPEKEWKLFGVFDESLNNEKDEESETDRNVRLVAENFNAICKICLDVEAGDLLLVEAGSEVAEKINVALFEKEAMELETTNLICGKCRKNVETLFEFKKQHAESLDILREFKKRYLIRSEESRGVKRKIDE